MIDQSLTDELPTKPRRFRPSNRLAERALETGAMCGDALELLQSLSLGCAAVVFFDPQDRGFSTA